MNVYEYMTWEEDGVKHVPVSFVQAYDENGDPLTDEFSFRACEACNSTLGGPRLTIQPIYVRPFPVSAEDITFDVCQDCYEEALFGDE